MNRIRVALVELPSLLGTILEGVLASREEIEVVRPDSGIALEASVRAGGIDAVVGRWEASRARDAASALIAADPGLLVLVVTGPPERFALHSRTGVRPFPADLGPAQLVDTLLAAARGRPPNGDP